MKKSMKTLCTDAGANSKKPFHHKSSQMNQRSELNKGKRVYQQKKKNSPGKIARLNDRHKNSLAVKQVNMKQSTKSRAIPSYRGNQNFSRSNEVGDSTIQSYGHHDSYHSQWEFQHQRALGSYPFEGGPSSSITRFSHSRPYANYDTIPVLEHHGLINHGRHPQYAYSNPINEPRSRSFNGFRGPMDVYRPLHPLPYRETYGQRRHGF